MRRFLSTFRNRVEPGTVSPRRTIPEHIIRPPYAATGEAPQMCSDVPILNEQEQQKMRKACQMAAKVLNFAEKCVQVGRSTDKIDALVHDFTLQQNIYPSPLNYCGFPKSICTSINEVIVHGIPDSRELKDGDIINIDVSTYVEGYHGDNSRTFLVGDVDEAGKKLVQVTRFALDEAIAICRPGVELRKIGARIHDISDKYGYTSVRQFTGHGVGSDFHLKPFILHFRNAEPGIMQPGMAFTIEPMFCEGTDKSVTWSDGWTVATEDGGRSAQFEHTILITDTGAEILTLDDL